MISYKSYMLKKYLKKNSIYGDLANDINIDKEFPSYKLFRSLYRYLLMKRACNGAIVAFLQSYIKYIDDCSEHFYRFKRRILPPLRRRDECE